MDFSGGGDPPSQYAPSNWQAYRYGITVSGSTTVDVNLPVVKISGMVNGADGPAVANASVNANSNRSDISPQASFYSNGYATTGSDGSYSMLLFAGTASFNTYPPSGTTYSPLAESNISFTGDTTHNVTLATLSLISGTIRGLGGNPIANANVNVYSSSSGQYLASGSTDSNGQYSVGATGTVYIYFRVGSHPPSQYAPSNWQADRQR